MTPGHARGGGAVTGMKSPAHCRGVNGLETT